MWESPKSVDRYSIEQELTTEVCKKMCPTLAASPKGGRVRAIKVLAEVAPVELAAVMVTELDETKILGGLRVGAYR